MRNANPDIIPMIKEKTLNLLMEKNPEAIGMRDIAKACGITATTIYHYYTDKDGLFQAIGLDCLLELNRRIINEVQKHQETREQILSAIGTFRDWSFENPRRALLIMQGIKSTENASPNVIEQFYTCNRTGENLLKKKMQKNSLKLMVNGVKQQQGLHRLYLELLKMVKFQVS